MYISQLKSIIAAMGREPWRNSRDFALELGVYKPKVFEVLRDNSLHAYHYLWSARTFSENRNLRMKWLHQNASRGLVDWRYEAYLRVKLYSASTRVTSGHGIILILFADVGIKSDSVLTFGLVSSGTLWWAPAPY
jgi:hypothetical protein